MRTALDTSLLLGLWSKGPLAGKIAQQLGAAKSDGALMIAPVVYVELLAWPNATEVFVNDFLADTGINIDFNLREEVWTIAGRRSARNAHRQRKSGSQVPKSMLADFLIGSHALVQADRLMSLDFSRYRRAFPELKLI